MTELTTWQPPQAKIVKRVIVGGASIIAISIAAFGITKFVPTWIDAINLLNTMLRDFTSMLITGGILVGVGWLLYETFSPSGSINKLFSQAYNSFINQLTWELLDIDPITPLLDKKKEMTGKKIEFDEAFAQFDGMIEHLAGTEARYVELMDKAESRAKAAKSEGNAQAFKDQSYDYGRYKETAANFARMRVKLEPVRATILKLQEASAEVIRNLETDIRVLRDQWEAQKSMGALDKAGRVILGKNSREDLAAEAQALIQQRYSEQIGRLQNLSDTTRPLLESIDLDKAAFGEDLLAQWSKDAAMISAPTGQPMPMMPIIDQTSFASLIRPAQ
jgi:hypothetical protein